MDFTTIVCAYCGKPTSSPDPNHPLRFCGFVCARKAGYRVTYDYDENDEPLREREIVPIAPTVVESSCAFPQTSRHFPLLLDRPPEYESPDITSPLADDVSMPV